MSKRDKKDNPIEFLDSDPDGFEKQWVNEIDGFGLFAKKTFDHGDFLLNYRGIHYETSDSSPSNPYSYEYEAPVGRTLCIDAADASTAGMARYVNDVDPFHTANAKPKILPCESVVGGFTISFRAVAAISSGKF